MTTIFPARQSSRPSRAPGGSLLAVVAFLASAFDATAAPRLPKTGPNGNRPFTVAFWGDLPYSQEQEATGVPHLIADVNAANVAFSVHDGDLKVGGGTPCDDALYQRALGWFQSFTSPALFTPGDNDWTDCDRQANGGFSSRERLDHERQVFFSSPLTMGGHPFLTEVQATPDCLGAHGPTPCVENRRWTYDSVLFATLSMPGSCNNLCDESPDPSEHAARNAANIAWMREAFQQAKTFDLPAVVLITQANPGWDVGDGKGAPQRRPGSLEEADNEPDGFRDFLLALREEVIAFGKPVLYVHGDTHYFRIDQPFLDESGRRLETFTRLETFGSHPENDNNDARWVKVIVDPRSREIFSFQPQIVEANLVAVKLRTDRSARPAVRRESDPSAARRTRTLGR